MRKTDAIDDRFRTPIEYLEGGLADLPEIEVPFHDFPGGGMV